MTTLCATKFLRLVTDICLQAQKFCASQDSYTDSYIECLLLSGDLGITAGSLPGSWGSQGAFAELNQLFLTDMPLTGTLPVSWGNNLSFPSLTIIQIGSEPFVKNLYVSKVGGTLPSQWASPGAFHKLRVLTILEYHITGAGHVPKVVFQSFHLIWLLHMQSCITACSYCLHKQHQHIVAAGMGGRV